MQKLKQHLEKGLELLSELSLELTDAEKLDAVIKLLPYLKSVSNEEHASKKPINQFLPETFPEVVQKFLTKQLYEKYVFWCESQGFPPENIGNFATFLHRLNVERNSTVQTNVYDVLESKTPKWPCSLD